MVENSDYFMHYFIYSMRGPQGPSSNFRNNILPPTTEEVNAIAGVCLSVCLSVSKITQKRVDGFG